MPIQYDPVQPGDVISSRFFNELLAKVEELDQRVHALETEAGETGAVVITGFNPPNQQSVGQLLEIIGANFAFPPAGNSVTIAGASVTEFVDGSTTSLIRLIVPSTVQVPDGGANVTVRVRNETGSAEVLYRILPEVPATGDPPVLDPDEPFTNADGSAPPVAMGAVLVIHGDHFAEDPLENGITFRVTTQGGSVTYPPAAIDADASSTTEIHARVPDIAEIPGDFNPQPVVVELVVGAHPPVAGSVAIWRVPG